MNDKPKWCFSVRSDFVEVLDQSGRLFAVSLPPTPDARKIIEAVALAVDSVNARHAAPAATGVADAGEGAWIPVGERLPVRDVRVLAYFGGRPGIEVATLDRTGLWNSPSSFERPSHWMPLPSAPAGTREGDDHV